MNENIYKLLLSFLLSSLLGLEREMHKKPAGLRTHILVGVGTTIFTILSYKYFGPLGADPSRVAAYVLSAVGMLGAGAIIKEEQKVVGLTTAASLWLTSAVGMAVGIGTYDIAITGTVLGLLSLFLRKFEKKD